MDFHYEQKLSEVYEKQLDANSDVVKYEKFNVTIELPELTGTEKQVAWAEDIRAKAIRTQIDQFISAIDKPAIGKTESRKKFVGQINERFGTNYDNFSEAFGKFLSEVKKGALDFYAKTTSAKTIIENR